ncbi:biotin--[acetyl-CoA-carboxylase] ligase [Catelliglobosispora koreensis]|uniref:biotin--[acetyl-CoA-carboxylase] ligase n=1 Tax=Catelliglobosispora koreensis TaxID=129052 RepID=UPI00037CE0EB|nr:biotin--[acetyl-CoA-carboxylase] ligase [Catelliglobosispora koreensis]
MRDDVLDAGRITSETGWRAEVKETTGSTNADVVLRAQEPERLVVFAEEQTAGRGRLARTWASPKGQGLWFSMLLRPTAPMWKWGLLPLITGVALAEAVEEQTNLKTGLKWPNDLLIDDRKCAGILAEAAVPGAVIVGVGLNVWQDEQDLPTGPTAMQATSLTARGAQNLSRTSLAIAFLNRMTEHYETFEQTQQLTAYQQRCWSIGREVRVTTPGGEVIAGTATGVDSEGRLIVGNRPIAAGDVTHVR